MATVPDTKTPAAVIDPPSDGREKSIALIDAFFNAHKNVLGLNEPEATKFGYNSLKSLGDLYRLKARLERDIAKSRVKK